MAYTYAWNESSPLGSADAGTIETIIQQEVKIAIRERLEDLIPDWATDAVDPKVFAVGSARIFVGTEAARPATPANDNTLYFASDTERLFIGVSGAWVTFDGVASFAPNYARVNRTGTQSITSNASHITSNKITWQQEVLDVGDFWATSPNPTRLTVPEDGLYRAYAQIRMAGGATAGTYNVAWFKNAIQSDDRQFYYDGSTIEISPAVHFFGELNENDYLEVSIQQATGDSWTVQLSATETFAWIRKELS